MPYKDHNRAKEHQKTYWKNRYHNDLDFRNKHMAYVKTRKKTIKKRNKLIITQAKKSGCLLCLEKEPCCLLFHHLEPSKKSFSISSKITLADERLFRLEISKCIVLCANCHFKVHSKILSISKPGL